MTRIRIRETEQNNKDKITGLEGTGIYNEATRLWTITLDHPWHFPGDVKFGQDEVEVIEEEASVSSE